MQDSMVLSNDERLTLLEVMAMVSKICELAEKPNIFVSIARVIAERSPESSLALQLMLMRLGNEGEYEVTSKSALRSIFTDVFVNMGQLHTDCVAKFFEYSQYDMERMEKEKDFIAVEFAEKLIEPNLLEKFKPIMFKLGEKNDAMVN